jgi:signal peptidase II
VAVFVADLVSKTIVVATLSDRAPVRLLGGLLTLRELRNSGAAFSIGTSVTVVFTLIALGIIVAILRTARRLRSIPWAITLGLLLGGRPGTSGTARSPGFRAATWWTGSSCRTGRCSTWPTRPSVRWRAGRAAGRPGISLDGRHQAARAGSAAAAREAGEAGGHGHGPEPRSARCRLPAERGPGRQRAWPGPAAPRPSGDGTP